MCCWYPVSTTTSFQLTADQKPSNRLESKILRLKPESESWHFSRMETSSSTNDQFWCVYISSPGFCFHHHCLLHWTSSHERLIEEQFHVRDLEELYLGGEPSTRGEGRGWKQIVTLSLSLLLSLYLATSPASLTKVDNYKQSKYTQTHLTFTSVATHKVSADTNTYSQWRHYSFMDISRIDQSSLDSSNGAFTLNVMQMCQDDITNRNTQVGRRRH